VDEKNELVLVADKHRAEFDRKKETILGWLAWLENRSHDKRPEVR
jgi:hypothetical protein